MAGIKETLEVVALVDKSADMIIAAKADGSIDWKDLAKLGPVIAALKAAVDGGNLLVVELKDLDAAETEALFAATTAAVTKLVGAIVG